MIVLVCGASGFIGLRITRRLQELGHTVVAFSKTYNVTGSSDIVGDLRDRKLVAHVLQERKPDAVIYCASRPRDLIDQAQRSAARIEAVKVVSDATPGLPFLYLSSRKIHTDPAGPYTDAQLACERIMVQRNPLGTILRLPAVYGPGRRAWLRWFDLVLTGRVRSVASVVEEIMGWVERLYPQSGQFQIRPN